MLGKERFHLPLYVKVDDNAVGTPSPFTLCPHCSILFVNSVTNGRIKHPHDCGVIPFPYFIWSLWKTYDMGRIAISYFTGRKVKHKKLSQFMQLSCITISNYRP